MLRPALKPDWPKAGIAAALKVIPFTCTGPWSPSSTILTTRSSVPFTHSEPASGG